jgi:hypothetical protein
LTDIADSLREAIERCRAALRGEVLPHQVDAWEMWETLSRASEKITEPEEHLLYASLMRLIIETVRLQCRWLRYEADELYVDSDIAREKVNTLSMRTLNSIFLKSYHPIVEVEQLTERAIRMGTEHWEYLTEGAAEEVFLDPGFLEYDAQSSEARSVLQRIRFDELLDELEREIVDMAATNGNEVPYGEFVSRGGSADFSEMVSRSYLGSFLLSQGRVGMVANGSDLKLVPGTGAESDRTQTLAIILRRFGGN